MRKRLLRLCSSAALLAALVLCAIAWMARMPERPYEGAPAPLSEREMSTRDRLKGHVYALAAEIGERNYREYDRLERARTYIDGELRRLDYAVEHQRFEFDGRPFYNLEARLSGGRSGQRSVVIGAHYDSVEGSPGANDNASGVAALLELAREFQGQDLPIRFVAFTNEEPPFFNTMNGMGSIEYVRRTGESVSTVSAMLSLETIGFYSDAKGSQHYPPPFGLFYPDKANFIAFVGNIRSRKLVRAVVREFRRGATIPSEGVAGPAIVPGFSWSDHRSFWQAGIPAIMVTDTALFRDPEYHLRTDTPERLDYERMARVVSGLVHAIGSLARERNP